MGPEQGAISVMAFGLLFGAVGGTILFKARWLRHHGARAYGTVVRLARSSGEGGTSYHPVVQYQTGNGRMMEVRSSQGKSGRTSLRPGTPVTVFYDPAKPQRMAIDGYSGGGGMVAFCVFGAVIFAIGARVLVSTIA
ncbi:MULTISPECIES: DUF3592 domain-containing protein [unclassified Streptomyces]|uniref:DUF3592 domain-containing protein n=1 Tax=unclassified Streptomyces TaxID=2593676 RepID=UPI002E14E88C|nr:DUF3592 domain-containing protein [Streptomyces sp. NBC_01197]WSS51350.1 DUF3592 domain-containing protein [Streptomyces sp. NBC_01180]